MTNPTSARSHTGRTAYHAGAAAELSVARWYTDHGYQQIAERWRGGGGEIDLIFQSGDGFVFVEVKKSRTFEGAALRISPKQRARIFAAASVFVSTQPHGQLSNMRFDAALVNATGQVKILESALALD